MIRAFSCATPDGEARGIQPEVHASVLRGLLFAERKTGWNVLATKAIFDRHGRVLQGPPPRPLPKIQLEQRGDQVFAVGVERQEAGEGI